MYQTNTRSLKAARHNRLTPISLGLLASFIITGSSVADVTGSTATQISGVPNAQPTAIAQAVAQRVADFPADNPSAFDGMLLAEASTLTTTQTIITNNTRELTQARIDELMAVDNREVDDIAARLKEIIHARHLAENQSLESLTTIQELQAQLAELEALLQNTNAQKTALSVDQNALQEKLDQIIAERDTAQNDLNLINDELRGQLGSVQALKAETLNAGEQLTTKDNAIAELTDQLDALTSEHAQAVSHADDLTDQLLKNQNSLDELTARYNEVSAERDDLHSTNDGLSNDVSSMQNNLGELQTQLNTMAESREKAERKIAELQTQIDGKESILAARQTDLGDKENLLDGLRMQLQLLAEEKDTTTDKLAELEAGLTEKTNYLADMEARLAGLASEKEEAQHQIKLLEDRLVDSENAATEVSTANNDLSERLSLFEGTAEESQHALLAEQQAHVQTRTAFESLEAEAAQLRAEIDSLIAERDALESEKKSLHADSNELLGSQKAMQKDLDIYELNLQTAADSAAKLKENLAVVKAERDDAAAKAQSLNDELDALNNEISVVRSEQKLKLENANERFAAEKAQLHATIAEQTSKLDDLTNTTAQQDSDIEDLENKIAMLETEKQNQHDSAQSKIVERDNEIIKLSAKVAELESDREQLNSLNLGGQEKLNQITSRIQGLLKEQDLSSNELAQLKSINSDLSDELVSLKQKLQTTTTDRDQRIASLNAEIEQLLYTKGEVEAREAAAIQQIGELTTARDAAMAEQEKIIVEAEKLRLSLTDELDQANLDAVSVQDARSDNSVPVRLGNADFFAQGSAQLTTEGANRLTKLAKIIKNFDDRRIVVEGHTDTVPIGPGLKSRFASNWELSVARAATAVRHMQSQANIDPRQMNASGFGEFQPVASNDTEEGRQQNRRVEVVLYPVQEKYETISSVDE